MRDPKTPLEVAVAVLNWNGFELTRACIASLAGLSTPHRVFVVDNGSEGPDVERLRSEIGVEVVALPRNGGVAYGYNAAIRHAHALGYPYVLLLNNDTLNVDPQMLDKLLTVAKDDSVAIASPLILEQDGRLFSAGGRLTWWGAAVHQTTPTALSPYPSDWVDGSAILVQIRLALAAGLMSEDYFLYWEEVDWCARLRRAGYQVMVVPSTKIVHLRGRTRSTEVSEYYQLRNGLLFHRKFSSRPQNAKYLLRFLLRTVPAYLLRYGLLRGRLPTAMRLVARAVAWNLSDVAAGRFWLRRGHERA
jgi:GT2 family glycosyltransferase